jgi:hypothetical protein
MQRYKAYIEKTGALGETLRRSFSASIVQVVSP